MWRASAIRDGFGRAFGVVKAAPAGPARVASWALTLLLGALVLLLLLPVLLLVGLLVLGMAAAAALARAFTRGRAPRDQRRNVRVIPPGEA